MKEMFHQWLQEANEKNASDVHLTVNKAPVFRIHGKLVEMDGSVLQPSETEAICQVILSEAAWRTLQEQREIDFSYTIDNRLRFRMNAFYQRGHLSLAIRLIPTGVPTFEQLHMPSIVQELTALPQGLILVTGPTGSGKTTTLASMIDYINKTTEKHIITLEDPIEYLHAHRMSIIDQREVGPDTRTFVNGLRASLRQDPDIILVGEMRDQETIATAITAAETGHLVLSTLHTSDAVSTIERIIDVFPPEQQGQIRIQLSSILKAVISQRLFPTLDGMNRRVATEVLVNTPAVKNLIRNEKLHQIQNVLQTSKDAGMHTLEMDLRRLLQESVISYETVAPYLNEI
ncbi:type IV pilus twitching motility protein PilT [Virgibacillus sp. W0181]|uniref:type IV pilus twitching motility protein PilT n=1 Tax=Virgibacillus sp. W0181 TaxID=3391581 RepID=UPI003F4524FF